MVRQQYRGLSPAEVDEVWRRMRAGHAMKPTARALGLPTSRVVGFLAPAPEESPPAHAVTDVDDELVRRAVRTCGRPVKV